MTLLGATIRALGPAAVTKFRVERQPAEGLEIQSAGLTNERESILAYLIPSIRPNLYLYLYLDLLIYIYVNLARLVTVSLHVLMDHNTPKMECRFAMGIT